MKKLSKAALLGATAVAIIGAIVMLLLTVSMGDHTLWYWLCTPWWLS
jgi:hypothetical protein